MSGRTRVIVVSIATLVVCVLFFVLFIRPRQADLRSVNEEITAAQDENQSLNIELERLKALQADAPELNATLEQIRGFVPKDDELPNFIFQVQEAANLAGVGFVQVTPELPKTPPEQAPLAEIRTTIRAQGGYFSLQDFVRRLYALDRALRIDTLSIAAEGAEAAGTDTGTTTGTLGAEEGDLTLNIAARVFFELPEGAAVGAAPAPGTTPAPATTPAPTDTAAPAPAPTS